MIPSGKSISIYGSCVSRDIFSFVDRDDIVDQYVARMSLHSYTRAPISPELIPPVVREQSTWEYRMIYGDMTKRRLDVDRLDWLLIDFIDERMEVLGVGDSLVTQSVEFLVAQLGTVMPTTPVFKRGSREDRSAWISACKNFRQRISGKSDVKIVLHESYLATEFRQEDGTTTPFLFTTLGRINRLLNFYYSSFAEIVGCRGTIRVPEKLYLSDPRHKWGLAPFHFIREYYVEAFNQLTRIMEN